MGRWTYRTSATGVLILAAAAFTLSYDALHQLALDSSVRPGLAWLWPVVIDGTIVIVLLTVLAAKRAAARAGYPWALAGLFSSASVAFNDSNVRLCHGCVEAIGNNGDRCRLALCVGQRTTVVLYVTDK
jgi:hypothetical protein